jgi:hypothetical protein
MEPEDVKKTAEAVEGIVKAIPIYEDLLQPATQELGKGIETIAKTVNIALAPLSGLVWGYDQIKQYLLNKVTLRLSHTKIENITTPDPAIAGPAIEALRFSGCHQEIRDMFVNLVATSIDKETASKAHPAFVAIIKQLVPDEGKILKQFGNPLNYAILDIRLDYLPTSSESPSGGPLKFVTIANISSLSDKIELEHPGMFQSYIDNLCRLNLTKKIKRKESDREWECKELLHRKKIRESIEDGKENGEYNLVKEDITFFGDITLSNFGYWFKKSVIDDKIDPNNTNSADAKSRAAD